MLKGILVDFDGTFVDSIQPLYILYTQFLESYGAQGSKGEFQELNGPSLNEIAQILMQRHSLPGTATELAHHYRELLSHFYAHIARPFPGAVATLEAWKKQGLQTGLVTSAPQDLVLLFLKTHHYEPLFTKVFTADEVEKGKPDPALYRHALEQLHLAPEDALAIEDSPNGVKSARGAGILTLLFRPEGSGADAAQDWAQISEWVKAKHG